MVELRYVDLGRCGYAEVLELQRGLVKRVQNSAAELAYLLLVEHVPPVITLGIGADEANILASADQLASAGVEVHRTRRGGDVTYHGVGQLVAYPILQLAAHGRSIRKYVNDLEEVVLRVLSGLGLSAGRQADARGVWVGPAKIAAVGVAVSKWVSYHGLAINVSPNMEHFGLIVPCGLRASAVTGIEQGLGQSVEMDAVKSLVVGAMAEVFGFAAARQVQAADIACGKADGGP